MDSALHRIFEDMLPFAGKTNDIAWQCVPVQAGQSYREVIRTLEPGFQLTREALRWAFASEHCGRLNFHALWWNDDSAVLTFLRLSEELTKRSTELLHKDIGTEPPSSTCEVGGLLRYSTWLGGLLDWMVSEFMTGDIPVSVERHLLLKEQNESSQHSFTTLWLLDTVLRMKDRFPLGQCKNDQPATSKGLLRRATGRGPKK
jgi:hypothetical protein